MDVTQLNTKIANLEKTLAELKTLKAAYESTISKQELLDRYDFDCDGILSCIDCYIPVMAALEHLDGDPLYDKTKMTYNGKSMNLNGDDDLDVTDTMLVVDVMLNEIRDVVDAEISVPKIVNPNYEGKNILDIIKDLYNSKGKVIPKLQEVKALAAKKS